MNRVLIDLHAIHRLNQCSELYNLLYIRWYRYTIYIPDQQLKHFTKQPHHGYYGEVLELLRAIAAIPIHCKTNDQLTKYIAPNKYREQYLALLTEFLQNETIIELVTCYYDPNKGSRGGVILQNLIQDNIVQQYNLDISYSKCTCVCYIT